MALLRADDRAVMFQDQSKRTFNSMLAYDCHLTYAEMIFFYVCCYCNFLFRDEPVARPHEETD